MAHDNKSIPGDLLIRLIIIPLCLTAIWLALPIIMTVQIWRRIFSYQIAKDLAWCTGFAALCALLSFL